ncbi:hypothetical protein [Microscilla marina]|uniref:TIR domain-containing protein n=1 Tax=Microscilla marina ATCC 23134 TaxID=313606 RepID=A1ZX23_MICM2|nr:hypothetical protein [Microscilla marina]EAY25103.1 hypothetical protein M23134_06091 [Microscilla marina ATCC 23134]
MNSTINIVTVDYTSENDKWHKAFKNYLAYALNEKHNITIYWQTIEEVLSNTRSEDIPTFILGVYSAQNIQNPEWQEQVAQLNNWGKEYNNAHFYKILREIVKVDAIPENSETAKQIAFYAHNTKSGELISEEVLLSSKINQFLFKTFELARDIALQVKQISSSTQISDSPDRTTITQQTVFLSQVSPQSSPLREKLKQELISQGFRVIPSVNYSIHPPTEIRSVIYNDLKQSDLVIHLFGEEIDHRQDGVNNTIEAIQNEVSAKYSKEQQEDDENVRKRVIWITNSKLDNEQYKRYINNLKIEENLHIGGDIYRCTIEELKDIILSKLKHHNTINNDDDAIDLSQEFIEGQVYLMPDVNTTSDMHLFKTLLEEHGFSTVYLNNPKTQQEAKEQNEAFLFQSEGVVIIHNEHNIRWVRAKVNDIFRIKSKGRKKDFRFKIILSRTIDQLPQEPIYRDIQLVHPEAKTNLDFLGAKILEKTE